MSANSSSTQASPDGFKRAKAALGWVWGGGASTAAVLYAAGYLALRGRVLMLGLPGLTDFDHKDVVQEGGLFFYWAAEKWFPTVIGLWLLFGLVVVVAFLIRKQKIPATINELWHTWVSSPWPWVILFVCCAVMLTMQAGAYLKDLGQVFPDHANDVAECKSDPPLFYKRMIRSNEIAILLLFVAWTLTASKRIGRATELLGCAWLTREWLLLPFVLFASLTWGTLPVAWGVFELRQYPLVRVSHDPNGDDSNDKGYLLRSSSDGIVLWHQADQRVSWLARDSIKRVDVVRIGSLCANADATSNRQGHDSSNLHGTEGTSTK